MITIRADNLILTKNSPYSYLNTNYIAGVTDMVVVNWIDFKPDDYVLIGEWGSENTEIVQVSSIKGSTNTITLKVASKFSHAESTKVTIIRYNMVLFYHTTTTTFSTGTHVRQKSYLGNDTTQFDITNPAGTTFRYTWDGTGTNPLIADFAVIGNSVYISAQNFNASNNGTFVITGKGTNYFEVTNASGVIESNKTIGTGSVAIKSDRLAIASDSQFTDIFDDTYTTGYGWYLFYNSTTDTVTQQSNYIPYSGFEEDSTKSVLDRFFDILSNSEQKLITTDMAYSWMNEGYSKIYNALGLVNKEYNSPSSVTITTTSGTAEYLISTYMTDFADIISVYCGTEDNEVGNISLDKIDGWNSETDNTVKYFIRGNYIGFSPVPAAATAYTIRYATKSATVSSYIDELNLPDGSFYCVTDWMLFRASMKASSIDGAMHKNLFDEAVKVMQLVSHKRDANLDSWGIANNANV